MAGLLVVAGFNPFMAALVLVGMAPAIVAWFTSGPAQVYRAPCIGYFALCGVVPTAWNLWQAGPSSSTLALYMSDPLVWLVMYGPAAMGGLIYVTIPTLHETMFARRLQQRRRRLLRLQRQLVEEWGPRVNSANAESGMDGSAAGAEVS